MCFEPVAWVGRWKFPKGWTKVWSCDRHTDELVGGGIYQKNISLVSFQSAQIPCR